MFNFSVIGSKNNHNEGERRINTSRCLILLFYNRGLLYAYGLKFEVVYSLAMHLMLSKWIMLLTVRHKWLTFGEHYECCQTWKF